MAANSEKTRKPHPAAFPKGKSGNPSGRPKRTEEELDLIAACKSKTKDALNVVLDIMTKSGNEKNRLSAAEFMIERAWGKAVQATTNAQADCDVINTIKRIIVDKE